MVCPSDGGESTPESGYTTIEFTLAFLCFVFVFLATVQYMYAVSVGSAKPLPVTWIAFAVPTLGSAIIHYFDRKGKKKRSMRKRDVIMDNALNWADILSVAFILLQICIIGFRDQSRVIFYADWLEWMVLLTTLGCMIGWYRTNDHQDAHGSLQLAKSMGYFPVIRELWYGAQTEPFWGWFLYWIAAVLGLCLGLLRRHNGNGNNNKLAVWYSMRPTFFCGLIWILILRANNWPTTWPF